MTSCQEKVIFLFNKFYYSFVEDLIKTCVSLKESIEEKCKVRNIKTNKNIERFKQCLDDGSLWDTIVKGESVRTNAASVNLIKSISFGDIVNNLSDEKDIVTVECYTYIFTLFAYLYGIADEEELEALFSMCTNAIRDIQKGEDYSGCIQGVYDEKVLALLTHVSNSMATSKVRDVQNDEESQSDNATLNILENSKIGSLAKEISEEIDLSSIKAEKPEDIIGSLMSGDGALNNIIGKVGSKIQSKIQSGEIKHEELLSDAFSMLNMLNKNAGGSGSSGLGGMGAFMNNPMFSQMMKSMQSGMFAQNNERARAGATKDRLRKKHESKHSS